jgi:mono/diheme cytochrome c family protein
MSIKDPVNWMLSEAIDSLHSNDRTHIILILSLCLSVALTFFAGIGAAVAQNVENGQRLSERWCSQCHAIGPAPGKFKGVPSFASIANREIATPEMIASFLRMPHATMPNFPLSRKDAQDISAFIIGMKK